MKYIFLSSANLFYWMWSCNKQACEWRREKCAQ